MTADEVINKNDVDFPMHLDSISAFEARRKGAFGEIRAAMRSINKISHEKPEKARTIAIIDRLDQIREHFKKSKSLEKCDLEAKIEILIPELSFENNDVQRMLLTFANASRREAVTMAILIKFDR